MNARKLPVAAMLVLLVGACTGTDPHAVAARDATMGAIGLADANPSRQGTGPGGSQGPWSGASRAAAIPDHGELLAYPGKVARTTGAYTWHRAEISEAHAINAIASGHLRLTTPDGRLLDVVYDRHVEHPSGDWSWIGHLAGHEGVQTVLTIGADAVFGSIGQDIGLPLRLTMRDGLPWLVETDASRIAALDTAVTRPGQTDFHVPPRPAAGTRTAAAGVSASAQGGSVTSTAATAASTTVDVLVGYTPGLRAAYGSASAVMTRLNFLIDTTNTAYVNGGVNGRVRMVHAMEVDYRDDNSNQDALQQMSGYTAGVGPSAPDPAFNALRAARETYGADLVTLVRDFRDPENDGCGIAWLLGGGLQGFNAGDGWDTLGYSVVSDGVDQNEQDGKSYYCRDATLAHELGHNMGAAHDQATARGEDGVLDNPDDYGAYTYSFGYKTGLAQGNFYTVMAYGDAGQTDYTIFSTPNRTTCGGNPCGTANADNVRTLNNTMPVVAGFRQSVSAAQVRNDFNADGISDLLWRNIKDGRNAIWQSANSAASQAVATVANLDWKVAGVGDFDGDARADIFWRNTRDGRNTIWLSANAATTQSVATVGKVEWVVAGVADFDADGRADLLWRNLIDGRNTIWLSADSTTLRPVTTVGNLDWTLVAADDFDGDGVADLLWRNQRDGRNSLWWSASSTTAESLATVPKMEWRVDGVGDFDGDSKADILWHNTQDGRNTIWKAANAASSQAVTTVPKLDWVVADTGDYDGDGKADLLWRNTSDGRNTIWRSANSSTAQPVTRVDNMAWQVVSPTM